MQGIMRQKGAYTLNNKGEVVGEKEVVWKLV